MSLLFLPKYSVEKTRSFKINVKLIRELPAICQGLLQHGYLILSSGVFDRKLFKSKYHLNIIWVVFD